MTVQAQCVTSLEDTTSAQITSPIYFAHTHTYRLSLDLEMISSIQCDAKYFFEQYIFKYVYINVCTHIYIIL